MNNSLTWEQKVWLGCVVIVLLLLASLPFAFQNHFAHGHQYECDFKAVGDIVEKGKDFTLAEGGYVTITCVNKEGNVRSYKIAE